MPKNWCSWWCWRRLLKNPLDCKEIKPVTPTGNQSWIFTESTDVDAKAPLCWPPDAKSWLTRKHPDAGKDWRQEMGTTEDEMVGWHYWLNGHEFEQALGDGERQGSLACCSPKGFKELDMTEGLNNNNQKPQGLGPLRPKNYQGESPSPTINCCCCCCCYVASVVSNSVWPHRWQPTRLLCPWDSPGKNTGVGCDFLQCIKVKSESEVTQSCPTLSDPMDCSLPGSSIHGIFQARVLEWGAIAFSTTISRWLN